MQQQMAHLDFAVNDLEKAVQHARPLWSGGSGGTIFRRLESDA